MVVLKALDKANSPISLTIPLADFANAYEGTPQEPKVFEQVQARLEREKVERKARCEAR